MANWQANLLMGVLSTGSVLVFSRDKTEENETPTIHSGDTFYGSAPDGDPFGGSVVELHGTHAVIEVSEKRYRMHKAQEHESNYNVTINMPHEFWVID